MRERKMTTAITTITNEFEGRDITTLTYRGKPAWIAREIGEAIGYSQGGKRLATKITGEWADEFIEGHDHVFLTGKELADFRAVFKGTDSARLKSNRGVILLFESGLYVAIAKTHKPVGKRLRRFIADEVMPQIARDGTYLPERQVKDGQFHSRNGSAVDPRLAREQRLARQLELEERKFQTKALKELVTTLRATGKYDDDVLATYDVAATETATGKDLAELKPATEHWSSPTEIAGRLGVTPQRVGITITKLGLRGNITGLARAVVSKATGHQRTVTSYVYSPRAVQQITDELIAGGGSTLRLV
jgi:prophage antirepressor-like protein